MRVSVPVAVWGEEWGRFAPEWFDAVDAMTRKPDEIVIGLEDPDRAHVHIRDLGNIDMRVVTLEPGGFNDYWNQVFDACTGDWIAPCCIDDRFLPDALAEIDAADAAGAELMVDGIVWKYRGDSWMGYWDVQALGRVLTLPGAAPFKRSLYDRIGGFRSDIYSSDWAFYLDAAAAGVEVYQASTLRIIFDEGNAHETRSGVRMSMQQRGEANEQIRRLAEELGLR